MALGWDWRNTMILSNHMVNKSKTRCNRYAQRAALGEPGLNEVTLVYWMVAHFSKSFNCDKCKAKFADLPVYKSTRRETVRIK